MGSVERRTRERETTRERIIDTAREMFAREGYEAVTMRRIAQKIEYTPTAIYHHFVDKDDLIAEICQRDFGALASGFARLATIVDPVERLRRIGKVYIDFALENPNHYRILFMTPLPPTAKAGLDQTRNNPDRNAYAFVLQTVQECIEAGRFRPEFHDPKLVAQLMWASVHGVASLHIAKGEDEWIEWRSPRTSGARMIDAMMAGVLRQPE